MLSKNALEKLLSVQFQKIGKTVQKTEQVWVVPTRKEAYDNSLKNFGSFSHEKESAILKRDEERLIKAITFTKGVLKSSKVGLAESLEKFQSEGYEIQGDKEKLEKKYQVSFGKRHILLSFPQFQDDLNRLYQGNYRFTEDGLSKYLSFNSKWFLKIDESAAVGYLKWATGFYPVVHSFPELSSQLTVVDSLVNKTKKSFEDGGEERRDVTITIEKELATLDDPGSKELTPELDDNKNDKLSKFLAMKKAKKIKK